MLWRVNEKEMKMRKTKVGSGTQNGNGAASPPNTNKQIHPHKKLVRMVWNYMSL